MSTARMRVAVSAVVGIAAGVVVALPSEADIAALVGWLATAATFIAWTWIELWPMDEQSTHDHARQEDPSRPLADAACLSAAVASLVAVGVVLVRAGDEHGSTKLLDVALAVGAVVAAWLLIHTVFALKYTRQYYGDPIGGIDFNQQDPPAYADFAYLAFTVGMTFQVSDTELQTSAMRRLVFRQSLLAYLMGAVIVAVMVNLVAGMTK